MHDLAAADAIVPPGLLVPVRVGYRQGGCCGLPPAVRGRARLCCFGFQDRFVSAALGRAAMFSVE